MKLCVSGRHVFLVDNYSHRCRKWHLECSKNSKFNGKSEAVIRSWLSRRNQELLSIFSSKSAKVTFKALHKISLLLGIDPRKEVKLKQYWPWSYLVCFGTSMQDIMRIRSVIHRSAVRRCDFAYRWDNGLSVMNEARKVHECHLACLNAPIARYNRMLGPPRRIKKLLSYLINITSNA